MNTLESAVKRDRLMLVSGGILIMLCQLSISANCFSLFIIPICESMGFARGMFSWTQSCLSLGGTIASLASGYIFSKHGIIRCMRIAGIISTALYFAQSFATTIPAFYIINMGIGFFNCFCTSMPLSLLIGERFTEKRNTVVGIVMMGSGFGTSLFNTVASRLILSMGWRGAMRVLGCIMGLVALVSYFVLVRELKGDAKKNPAAAASAAVSNVAPEPFFRGKRILIAAMCMMIAIGAGTFMSTLQPHLRDIGYSQNFAAGVYSISMLFMAAGKILHGSIIDKWGVRVSNSVMLITALMGLWGSMNFKSPMYAGLIFIGMMFISSLAVVGAPALAEALGGLEQKKYFIGKLSASINFGYFIAPLIYGTVYDKVGSYMPMYYVAAALLLTSLAGVLILLPRKEKTA